MSKRFTEFAINFLKLWPRYFLVIGIADAFLLFSSQSTLHAIGLFEFVQQYRPWLGMIFIICVGLLGIALGTGAGHWIRQRWFNR